MRSFDINILLLVLLIVVFLYKARFVKGESSHFFDITNTKAMRGFWCVVVILAHIPELYQNSVQNVIASFGYIGVTFFFMFSGYGLTLESMKKPIGNIKFWGKRLPKILITGWGVNIFVKCILFLLKIRTVSIQELVSIFVINTWVKWLLVCYLCFWTGSLILRDKHMLKYIFVCLSISLMSILMYILHKVGVISSVIWSTECYGFIWGVLLALFYEKFISWARQHWIRKMIELSIISIILGILYIEVKEIFFFGDYLLKIVLEIAIVVFILIINSRVSIGNKVSSFLGEISFEIYLLHPSVLYIVAYIYPKFNSTEYICICVGLTVVGAMVVHLIAKEIIVKIIRVCKICQ